jgi:hypothetical protein
MVQQDREAPDQEEAQREADPGMSSHGCRPLSHGCEARRCIPEIGAPALKLEFWFPEGKTEAVGAVN